MWDTFEPFKQLNFIEFSFNSKSYEIWENGQKIENGNENQTVELSIENKLGKDIAIIRISNSSINKYLSTKCEFDIFMTSNDRLQFFIFPEITNIDNNLGFKMYKDNFGATRELKTFEKNEPFCCNLFIVDSTINKITFNIGNPDRIIEFYSY